MLLLPYPTDFPQDNAWRRCFGVQCWDTPDMSPKPSFLRQSHCQALCQLLFISAWHLRPGGGGSLPPLSSRQFADLPVFLPRAVCQRALSHFPSKEGDISASGLVAEAARSQCVAHGEGFLFPVVLYIHSHLELGHSCKVFTFRANV